ncbi:hypothetical protein [uncultured Pseudacidovorax sp.]|uniref:cobalamin B12-binding domain-containing protein n=1 Tax=uncultured Pseudacidovorax sp. TaxID=679313 RepID=UPI0025EA35C7|nr:hypothetical protein [uncultured Pseudacidovorax sp.]
MSDNSGHAQQLSRVVEHEIIPRLLLMHAHTTAAVRREGIVLSSQHVVALAELAVSDDPMCAVRYVQSLQDAGATPHQVLLELLSPCAALMGHWWCEDTFNFTQVTTGLCRLQQALRQQVSAQRPPLASDAPRILFAAPPRAQHTFGAAVAAECFALAGWDARVAPTQDWDELKQLLAGEAIDILALSLSCDSDVGQVASVIVELRTASSQKRLGVLVGGPLALDQPDLAQRCCADGMALTAAAAVDLARRWLQGVGRSALTDPR